MPKNGYNIICIAESFGLDRKDAAAWVFIPRSANTTMNDAKQKHSVRKSYRVALGGIVAAFCLMTMFLTGVLPALYIAAPMAAGILLMILVEEVSVGWALLTYVAVSLLSMVVTFDKEAAIMFILFFGYYPILRPYGMRVNSKVFQIIWKLVLYNSFLVLDYWMTVYVLGLPTFDGDKAWVLLALAIAANIVFFIYDRVLGKLGWFIRKVFMPRVLGKKQKSH